MTMFYWAVRPISTRDIGTYTRIEKAETARKAADMAFGRGLPEGSPLKGTPAFEAKNLGTRVEVLQSNRKRIALLNDPKGWKPIEGY